MLTMSIHNKNLKNWYVFGDSLAKGIVLNSSNNRYELNPQNFVALLSENFKAKVKNFSSFGATINKGLQIFKRKQNQIVEPGIAFLEFGGNDCDFLWSEVAQTPGELHEPNVSLASYLESYRELIIQLKEKNIIPIILSLPPLEPDRYFQNFSADLNKDNLLSFLGGSTRRIYQWHENYNSVLPNLAIDTGAIYIDIRQAFLEEINPEKYICEDGIHPNEEGHKLIAKILTEKLSREFSDLN